jgi:hypothetical protein
MSNKIGSNLKKLAVILFCIIATGCFIAAIIIWKDSYGSIIAIAIGFAVLGGGTFVQSIISFLIYGLGRLIENTETISAQLDNISKQLSHAETNSSNRYNPIDTVQSVRKETSANNDDALPPL